MEVTKHEQSLIHVVMEMAYEQGVEHGRKEAIAEMKKKAEELRTKRRNDEWRKLP